MNQNKVAVVIVAAGSGKRMDLGGKNKVYLDLGGKTVLARSIAAFESHLMVGEIVVVVREDEIDYCKEYVLNRESFQKVKSVVPGGTERSNSVMAGLMQISTSFEYVLIHDGARPFVSEETISKVIEGVFLHGAAITGVPVTDTIKRMNRKFVKETLLRKELYRVQTPQAFRLQEIQSLLGKSIEKGESETDEAVLIERQGKKVFIVDGKYDNIKITTYEDFVLAEAILKIRKEQETP